MENQAEKRVWLYCRSARHEGNALQDQLSSLRDYAEQRGYKIVGTSQEIGSGFTLSHPELNKIKNFKKNMINALLVKNVSRISRDIENIISFAVMMKEKGIEIILLDEEAIDKSTFAKLVDEMHRLMIEDNKKRDKKAREFGKIN